MADLRLSEPNGYNIFCGSMVHHLLGYSVIPAIDERFTNMQEAVTPSQRASITLCYLDGGNTFEGLKFLRARSPQSIGIPVLQT